MRVAMLAALVLVTSAVATTDDAANREEDEETAREHSNKKINKNKHLKHSRRFLNRLLIQQYPGFINSPKTQLDQILQQTPGQLSGPFSKFQNRILCRTHTECLGLVCDELTHPVCYNSILLGQYCACLNKPVTTPDQDHIKNELPNIIITQNDQKESDQRKEDYQNILDQLKNIQQNQIMLKKLIPQQCHSSVVCEKCKKCPQPCTPQDQPSTDDDKTSYEYYDVNEPPSNYSNTESTEKPSKNDSAILSEESFDPYFSDVEIQPIFVPSNTTDHENGNKTYQANSSYIPINSSNSIRFIRNKAKENRLANLRKNENLLYLRDKILTSPFMLNNQNLTYAGSPFVDHYLYHTKNKLRNNLKLRQRYDFNEPKHIHVNKDTNIFHKKRKNENSNQPRQPNGHDLRGLKDLRNLILNPDKNEESTEILGPEQSSSILRNPIIKLIVYKLRKNHDDRTQYNLRNLLKKYYSIDDSKHPNFHDRRDYSREVYRKQLYNSKILSKIIGPYYDPHDLEEYFPFRISLNKKYDYPYYYDIDYLRNKINQIQNPKNNIRKRIDFINSFYNTDKENAIKNIINKNTNTKISRSHHKNEFIQFLKDNGYYSMNDLDDSTISNQIKATKMSTLGKHDTKKLNNESLLLETVDSNSPVNEYDNDDSNLIDASYDTSEDEPPKKWDLSLRYGLTGSRSYVLPSQTSDETLRYYNSLPKDKDTGLVEKQIARSSDSPIKVNSTQQSLKTSLDFINSLTTSADSINGQNISKNITFNDQLELSSKYKMRQHGKSNSKNNKTDNVVTRKVKGTSKNKLDLRTDTFSKEKLPVKPVTTNIKIRIKS